MKGFVKFISFVERFYVDIGVQLLLMFVYYKATQVCELANLAVVYSSDGGFVPESEPYVTCYTDFNVLLILIFISISVNLIFRNWKYLKSKS